MKVLWNWLLELVDLDNLPTVEEGARALTRGGLEIEGMTNLGAGFSGVVIAEVVAKRPHPHADKLTLVDVITERNGTATQVVCGAPNVPDPGRRVLWAQPGAVLPGKNGPITLATKAVKGIDSPGMLCAEDELGLGESHAGIIVLDGDDKTALGLPAQNALGLDDWMLEVNAPANRGDVLGHLGVAQELVAILRGKVVWPTMNASVIASAARTSPELAVRFAAVVGDSAPSTESPTQIAIADPALCLRYTALRIEGVRVGPPANYLARRIAQRLRGVGVRSISNVVDVTNYVMFELGQPLHAFDANTLTAGVVGVSPAKDGEKFTTLDNIERTLIPGDLVIRDGDRGIALAGVMGGLHSEVTDKTTNLLLESASFRALSVRRTARRLGLHSEASHRFERTVDPELAALASARAAFLFAQAAGGTVAGGLVDSYPGKTSVVSIPVRMSRVRMVSGVALDASTCKDALERLGCAVSSSQDPLAASPDPVFDVTPPSARSDIAREVDVIEEILRIVGYEQVPSTLPVLRQAPGVWLDRGDACRNALAAAGLCEAITFGFQSVERCQALGLAPADRRTQPIALRNPMSIDQAVMRTSLVPNLLAAIVRNQSYGRPDVALFEVGSVFLRRGGGITERPLVELADEPLWACGVFAGKRAAQLGAGAPWDAFDAKAFAERAIRSVAGDIAITTRATSHVAYLHPGIGGELFLDGIDVPIGVFGEVHPEVRRRLGVSGPAFVFDIELGRVPLAQPAQMTPIAKYPGSARDVSLLLQSTIAAGRIADVIAQTREPLVHQVRLLEDYRDAKLGDGMKSMLWSIEYRSPERTLTDVEVDAAHEAIVARLVDALPAQRR
ncbi:MAG: phenylalanine--tRNA ligase subunit beta [Kofleriaceae bacterium]